VTALALATFDVDFGEGGDGEEDFFLLDEFPFCRTAPSGCCEDEDDFLDPPNKPNLESVLPSFFT